MRNDIENPYADRLFTFDDLMNITIANSTRPDLILQDPHAFMIRTMHRVHKTDVERGLSSIETRAGDVINLFEYPGERGPASQGGPFPTINQYDYWKRLDPAPDMINFLIESNRPYGVVRLQWHTKSDVSGEIFIDPAGKEIKLEELTAGGSFCA